MALSISPGLILGILLDPFASSLARLSFGLLEVFLVIFSASPSVEQFMKNFLDWVLCITSHQHRRSQSTAAWGQPTYRLSRRENCILDQCGVSRCLHIPMIVDQRREWLHSVLRCRHGAVDTRPCVRMAYEANFRRLSNSRIIFGKMITCHKSRALAFPTCPYVVEWFVNENQKCIKGACISIAYMH